MNEAANYSARRGCGQDRKILPALTTNQTAGFGGFRPLASLKNKYNYIDKYTFTGKFHFVSSVVK